MLCCFSHILWSCTIFICISLSSLCVCVFSSSFLCISISIFLCPHFSRCWCIFWKIKSFYIYCHNHLNKIIICPVWPFRPWHFFSSACMCVSVSVCMRMCVCVCDFISIFFLSQLWCFMGVTMENSFFFACFVFYRHTLF